MPHPAFKNALVAISHLVLICYILIVCYLAGEARGEAEHLSSSGIKNLLYLEPLWPAPNF